MLQKKLLNFTFYQMVKSYAHIDGFTKESSPRLSYFLLGSYYNLSVFQIYYSISFLRSFCFVYNNIVIKGLPVLHISTLNIFKKTFKHRFLQYYSYGKWTHGLFSNWIYCKSFLNVSKYPLLNRKIKTIPKIIVALNNNYFLEKEVHNSFNSIITFTFINSRYASLTRYFAPLNPLSFISIAFYVEILNILYDKSFSVRLSFFWSFDFLKKIILRKLSKSFLKNFRKGVFKFVPAHVRKKWAKKKRRWERRRQKAKAKRFLLKKNVAEVTTGDVAFDFLSRKRAYSKKCISTSKHLARKLFLPTYLRKLEKKNPSQKSTTLKISPLFSSILKNKRKNFRGSFLGVPLFNTGKRLNFIFDYFKKILKLIVREKHTDLLLKIFSIVLNADSLLKIKKLIILKLFLRSLRFSLHTNG